MSDMNPYERDEESLEAAMLAMGLLTEEEREEAVRQTERDRAFAAEVGAWQRRLGALDEEFIEIAPPARVKRAVERTLFRAHRPWLATRLWRSTALWRGVAVIGAAAAVVLALQPGIVPLPGGVAPDGTIIAQPQVVSALFSPEAGLGVLAVYDARRAVLVVERIEGAPPEGRELEFWLIAPEEDPISLGLVTNRDVAEIPVTARQVRLLDEAAAFGISSEPPGGSPTGAPTEVIAVGAITAI